MFDNLEDFIVNFLFCLFFAVTVAFISGKDLQTFTVISATITTIALILLWITE